MQYIDFENFESGPKKEIIKMTVSQYYAKAFCWMCLGGMVGWLLFGMNA